MRPIPRMDKDTIARFWASSFKGEDCWEWPHTMSGGYGTFRIDGFTFQAHRVAWALEYGEPGNRVVRHNCDNKRCVRPGHLRLGTSHDNAMDTIMRVRRGGLTREEIREVFQSTETQSKIAARFGISTGKVRDIKIRRSWAVHTSDLGEPGRSLKYRSDSKGRFFVKRKLTDEQVIEVFYSEDPYSVITAKYGIQRSSITAIKQRRNNRHVTATLEGEPGRSSGWRPGSLGAV